MEEKYIDATFNRPGGERPLDAEVLLIDIPSFCEEIKNEKTWKEKDRNSITVFKTDHLRIVLIAMHTKVEMHTHHPENILSLQVIDGKLKLSTKQKSVEIKKGQVLALHEQIPYSLQGLEETTFLLTIVEQVIPIFRL